MYERGEVYEGGEVYGGGEVYKGGGGEEEQSYPGLVGL